MMPLSTPSERVGVGGGGGGGGSPKVILSGSATME